MNLVNYSAEIWGISLVLVPLALLINPRYVKRLFVEVENEATMLFMGIVSVVVGLAMVLVQNTWMQNWQTIITILGWLVLIKGLAILFVPDYMKKWVKKVENAKWLPIAMVVLVFIGLVLTYFGFTA